MQQKEKITLAILGEKLDNLIINNQEGHEAILEQVKRTNGRTSKLETWQNRIVGGLIVSNIIILPIIFIIISNWFNGK